jgi:hypothetical protein
LILLSLTFLLLFLFSAAQIVRSVAQHSDVRRIACHFDATNVHKSVGVFIARQIPKLAVRICGLKRTINSLMRPCNLMLRSTSEAPTRFSAVDEVEESEYHMTKHNNYNNLQHASRQNQGGAKMTDLKSSDELLLQLHLAAERELTSEELHRQRISYIYGTLKDDNTVTRARIDEVLSELEGRKSAA